MTRLRWLDLPFRFSTDANFYEQLNHWLSEVFYSTLPAAGFEIREEQIYTSFQIINAFRERGVLMAEAGSGTGKTFAYLLPALCYSRLMGQPVAIACSTAALQEQLVHTTGDIRVLSDMLNMNIKAVLAKDPANYLCAVQADMAKLNLPNNSQGRKLKRWLDSTTTGDRVELPEIDDELWAEVAYNETLDCRHCRRRGYCHQAKARQRLWAEQDFVICSHALFFRDLWTRRERMQKKTRLFKMAENKVPLLPPYSAVILDEGHLIEEPALSNLGARLSPSTITRIVGIFSAFPLVSDGLLTALEKLGTISSRWFAEIRSASVPVSTNQGRVSPDSVKSSGALAAILTEAMDEMAMYQQYDVSSYIGDLETFASGLDNWLNNPSSIAWWDSREENFWVLPRDFSAALGRELVSQNKPILLTSATLDANDNFAYYRTLTGIQARTSKAASPFDPAEQMKVWVGSGQPQGGAKARLCAELLRQNGGSALVLCNSTPELEQLRDCLQGENFSFNMYWEGTGDRSWLVDKFRRDKDSVLIGTGFWEGIDIPGAALTLIIIYSLPFPLRNPILLAKREAAAAKNENPDLAVDYPAMGIKLRQGMGRLIRSKEDFGAIAILEGGDEAITRYIRALLPPGVQVVSQSYHLFSASSAKAN